MEAYSLNNINFNVARSKKRKRTIAIYVSAKRGIEIKVPYATKLERIFALIEDRVEWIEVQLKRIAMMPEVKKLPWHEQDTLFYQGEPYTLHIETFPFAKKRGECQLSENTLQLTLAETKTELEQKQLVIKTLEAWYRKQAEIQLLERTHYFAELLKVAPKKIIIKTQKSRWGSCDSDNNIRYNWKIIMAAPELLDYLVVHELAHIRVKNHSKKFWQVVASILPDHELRRKKLREFGRGMTEL